MNKSEMFNAIADLLEQQGWIQDNFVTDNGRCVLGARNDVVEKQMWSPLLTTEEQHQVLKNVHQWTEEFGAWVDAPLTIRNRHSIGVWNDAEGRTKDEVVLTLRKYAEEVAHEQS